MRADYSKLSILDKMTRRKLNEQEHRFRQGVYDPEDLQKHPFAEGAIYGSQRVWEHREKGQPKSIVTSKIN